MKYLFASFLFLCAFRAAPIQWKTDFAKAQREAAAEHKFILLNFSGSDWCIPCIRLHKEVFESDAFAEVAEKTLVLANADFPRLKRNRLSKSLQEQNEAVADRYNPSGKFPYTLLLSADGTVLRRWEGFPADGLKGFLSEINQATGDAK